MKTIDKITMIHLLVRDMDEAKSFYADKLGFEATKNYEYGGNRWVVVVPPGGGTYVVLGTLYEELKPGFIVKMYLSTPDVEAAYKELKAKGAYPLTKAERKTCQSNSCCAKLCK